MEVVTMPSPFPGMNPYLENPDLWTEVHHLLISILAETLNPYLLPRYRAAIEKRVYLSGEEALLVGIPDVTVEQRSPVLPPELSAQIPANVAPGAVATLPMPIQVTVPIPLEIREAYLEIRDVATREVITVLELLSPSNKRPGRGRDTFLIKRQDVLASATHWVEIDLLRGGESMPVGGVVPATDYRILISRGDRRPHAALYAFNIPDLIPAFPLPLRSGDLEPTIDLHSLLDQVYDRAGYSIVLDYRQSPIPPLSNAITAWVETLLQATQLQ
jgi:hypothetical protein